MCDRIFRLVAILCICVYLCKFHNNTRFYYFNTSVFSVKLLDSNASGVLNSFV